MARKFYSGFTKEQALSLSAAVYRLSRPKEIAEQDVTKYAFEVIEHPSKNEAIIAVDDFDQLPVHISVKNKALPAEFVQLTTEERKAVRDLLKDSPKVSISAILPAAIKLTEIKEADLFQVGFYR